MRPLARQLRASLIDWPAEAARWHDERDLPSLEHRRDTPFHRTYQRVPRYRKCRDDVDSGNARILIPEILAGTTSAGKVSSN